MKYFYLLIVLFSLTACSNHKILPLKTPKCSYTHLNFTGQNSFCSSPRKLFIDNRFIFITFDNGDVGKWDKKTRQLLKLFDETTRVTKRAITGDKSSLYLGSSNMFIYKYLYNGKLINKNNYSKGSIFCLNQYHDKLYVAFGNAELGIVSKKTLKLLTSYQEHQYLIFTLLIDNQNQYLYSGSDDNSIIKWKILNNGFLKKEKILHQFNSAVRNILQTDNNFIVTSKQNIILYDQYFHSKLFVLEQEEGSIISSFTQNNLLITGNDKGLVVIYKINNNSLQTLCKYNLQDVIRIIAPVTHNQILIMSKSGEILNLNLEAKPFK